MDKKLKRWVAFLPEEGSNIRIVSNELDKTIISICEKIQKLPGEQIEAELIKALADLVEVRTCMPDWKTDVPE